MKCKYCNKDIAYMSVMSTGMWVHLDSWDESCKLSDPVFTTVAEPKDSK